MTPQAIIKSRYRRASILLEAALAVPILVSLAFGMIEFGYFMEVKNVLAASAREGARAGAPWNTTVTDINMAVSTSLQDAGVATIGSNYTVTVKDGSGNAVSDLSTVAAGTTFQVTVSATWGNVGVGFRPLGMIGPGKAVVANCSMKKEF